MTEKDLQILGDVIVVILIVIYIEKMIYKSQHHISLQYLYPLLKSITEIRCVISNAKTSDLLMTPNLHQQKMRRWHQKM